MNDQKTLHALIRGDLRMLAEKAFEHLNPGQVLIPNWHLDVLFDHAEGILAGEKPRSVIAAPPRSLKSFIFSVAMPAFALGHDPRLEILCVSHNSDLANKLSNDRRKVMESQWYKAAFPETRLSPRKNTEDYFETTQNGGCRAISVQGSGVTGMGGNILIVDDLVDAKDAHNVKLMQERYEWLQRSFFRRVNNANKAIIVVVGQRLHIADPIGQLLETGDYELLKISAIAQEKTVYHLKDRIIVRLPGQVMHEEMRDMAQLDRDRRTMTAADFAAQFLQEPIADGGGVLNWRWLPIVPAVPAGCFVFQSWDVARTPDGGDYTVGMTIACKDEKYFIVSVFRKQLDYTNVLAVMREKIRLEKPHGVIIETSDGSGDAAYRTLRSEGVQNLLPNKPKTSKLDRIYKIVPILEAGDVSILEGASYVPALRHEYLSFPSQNVHDDQLDALSQGLINVEKLARMADFPPPTKYFRSTQVYHFINFGPRRLVSYS